MEGKHSAAHPAASLECSHRVCKYLGTVTLLRAVVDVASRGTRSSCRCQKASSRRIEPAYSQWLSYVAGSAILPYDSVQHGQSRQLLWSAAHAHATQSLIHSGRSPYCLRFPNIRQKAVWRVY